jgi:DNA-binding transcriptional regulator LsrR (DeoR family)
MKTKQSSHPLDAKLQRVADLLEHLIAVEMYKGGAGQREIAQSMHMSLGKINGFVKGVRAPKVNHGEN